MSKLHRRLGSLPAGTRVLTGSARTFWPRDMPVTEAYATHGINLMTVTATGPGSVTLAGEDGTERNVEIDLDGRSKDWRLGLLWTDALPDGPVEAVKAYASVLLAGEAKTILLHVEEVDGGHASCRLVQPAGFLRPDAAVEHGPDTEDEVWAGDVAGNAAWWGEPLTLALPSLADMQKAVPGSVSRAVEMLACRGGDLVGGIGFRCDIEEGRTVTRVVGPIRIGNFSLDGLGAFLPWGVGETRSPVAKGMEDQFDLALYSGPAGFQEYREAEEVARVRLEPDEALVAWYRPVDAEPGDDSTACTFLGVSGITFHRVDSVEDYFFGAGVEEGLWVLRNARGWSYEDREGGWDSGIDGDWEPATEADLARFGYDAEGASNEIADRIEVDPRPDLAAELMAKAAEALRQAVPSM